jgi:hypothetical protein
MNMARAQAFLYAVVGAGDYAIEKARGMTERKNTTKAYRDLVARGRTLSVKIQNSGATKKAIAQTRTARSQAKAAATSATKAVRANARAARSATTKSARAS